MRAKLVLSLMLAAMVVLFIIQNVTVVEISFLFWTISMSRSLMIFFVLAIGIIIGWLLHGSFVHRRDDTFQQ
ncbi:MAG: hypothetical protein Kow0089_24950 [Desulfobulbaceae bacterium]